MDKFFNPSESPYMCICAAESKRKYRLINNRVVKATKLPLSVECIKILPENEEAIKEFGGDNVTVGMFYNIPLEKYVFRVFINTLEGTIEGIEGDWLMKGVNGEFYPCKADIFDKSFRIEGVENG